MRWSAAKLSVDFTSLRCILSWQSTRAAPNRLTSVMADTICAGPRMQSLELEEQFASWSIDGQCEEEVRHKPLPLPCRKTGSLQTASLGYAGSEKPIHFRTASDAELLCIAGQTPFKDIVLRPPAIAWQGRCGESQPMPVKRDVGAANPLPNERPACGTW